MEQSFARYHELRTTGRTALDACEAARLNGLDRDEQARMLLEVYGLDLVEARRAVLRVAAGSESLDRLHDLERADPANRCHWLQFRLHTLFCVPLLIGLAVTLWKWHWAPVATVLTFLAGCILTRTARNLSPRGVLMWLASVALLLIGMALVLWSPWLWVWGAPMGRVPARDLFLFGPIAIPLLVLLGVLTMVGASTALAIAYATLALFLVLASYWALHIEEGLAEFIVFLGSLITTLLVLSLGWY